jgi:hypothetical protein
VNLGSKQESKQANKQANKRATSNQATKQPSNQVTMVWLALAVALTGGSRGGKFTWMALMALDPRLWQ